MKNSTEKLLIKLGFDSKEQFKDHMLANAKPNEWGAICHSEKRQGLELNYSHNCKNKFGIGGVLNGMFQDIRFN
jgi:hypothetical protein